MLTEDDKNRILQEEQFRVEIQRQLKAPPRKGAGFINFLNSNFASFLLSTVIVGGLSFLYSNHQENLAKIERESADRIERNRIITQLETEMAHRLKTMATLSDSLVQYKSKDVYLAYLGASVGNDPSIQATFYNFKSYYDEYASYSLLKLIDELQKWNKTNDYSKLKNSIIAVNSDIVDLGQEWFYLVNSNTSLPKRVEILRNSQDGVYFYRINGELTKLRPQDKFKKIWFIGDRSSVKTLLKEINVYLN